MNKLEEFKSRIATCETFILVEELGMEVVIDIEGKAEAMVEGNFFKTSSEMEYIKGLGLEEGVLYPLIAIQKHLVKDKVYFTYKIKVDGVCENYKSYWFKWSLDKKVDILIEALGMKELISAMTDKEVFEIIEQILSE